MRNRVIVALGIVAALVVIALLVLPSFIDVNQYRPQIEAELRERLGRDVSLGPMRLSLLPLAFRVDNATIGEDPQFNTGLPFAQVQTLFVRPKLMPLLHHDLKIKSFQLSRPAVELVRNERGTWNFANLMQYRQQTQRTVDLSLDRLKVTDGQVAITDMQERKPRTVYDHIDLDASDPAPDKAFSVDIRAHLPGSGNQIAALRGTIGPFRPDALTQTPLDGTLKLDAVSLSGLKQFLNVQPLAESDAVLSGKADLKNNAGILASRGDLVISNPHINGVDVGYPISIDYQIDADINHSAAVLRKVDLKLGQTPVSLNGNVNAQTSPAQIDLNIEASNASVAEAARLAAAFGAAFDAKTNVRGTVDLKIHAQGAATRPAMTGQITARNIRASGGDLREPVEVDAVDLSLTPDAVRSNEFTAKAGHTKATAQFNLLGYATPDPKVEARLNTVNADIQELLSIAQAFGVSDINGVKGSGVLTLDANVSGPIKRTGELAFSGRGAIQNASIETPGMAKPIAVRKADLQFSGNGVNLNDFDASIGQTTAHGTAVVTNFDAPHVQFTIAANHINIAEWEQLFKAVPANAPAAKTKVAATKVTDQDNLLSRTTGNGALTVDTLVYDDLKLNQVRSNVTLDHGVITLNPLTANLYNGQESGTVIIDTHATPVTYTVNSHLQGVDANQLLSSISTVKTLYGLLSANADTHFTTAAGAHSILPTLSGRVSLNLKDGKIANVDLLHHLSTIGQFNQTAQAIEPFTQLNQLSGNFDIRNGVAQTNDLKASISAGSMAASGVVDLAREQLNLHLTAVLSSNYSQSVGGTGIGGFLNTALANANGELVIPVLVTGTFQNPQFAPDLQRVAEMKLKNVLPGVDNPAALTKGILGQVLRGKPGQPGQSGLPVPAAVPNSLKNLFDTFGKNK
jgi:uncharacterized protein involved in outer membrane biogenesis